jgi:hypothetical protein
MFSRGRIYPLKKTLDFLIYFAAMHFHRHLIAFLIFEKVFAPATDLVDFCFSAYFTLCVQHRGNTRM